MDLSKDVLEAHVRSVHLPSVHNEPTKTLTCPVAHFDYRKQIEKPKTGNVCLARESTPFHCKRHSESVQWQITTKMDF